MNDASHSLVVGFAAVGNVPSSSKLTFLHCKDVGLESISLVLGVEDTVDTDVFHSGRVDGVRGLRQACLCGTR